MESNLAVLIDFENIAAGAEREGLGRFDVDALMKRLKDKGRILVSRSYADWGRFARFKQNLLTANVTMMELTSHGMQDKNRADIAMVVDCLELAFTRDYIDTFVLVSGDSDFTPLVLKMRELNKKVIGCGTRKSTSRLIIQACDEFIFYDTIAKDKRAAIEVADRRPVTTEEAPFELLVEALEGLQRENPAPALASVVKIAMVRKSSDFDEVDLGFGSFARFLDAAQEAGYVRISRDQKSGGYRVDSADAAVSSAVSDDMPREVASDPALWRDPRLPARGLPFAEILAEQGLNPHSHATRLGILALFEETIAERRKRRRRITGHFVQDDVRKRLQRAAPDMPSNAVRPVFDALLRGGLLIHRDGRPIRSLAAPFVAQETAERLHDRLVRVYVRALQDAEADLSDAAGLSELLFGTGDRAEDVRRILAEPPEAPAEPTPVSPEDEGMLGDLDFDQLLLTDESPAGE